MRRAWSVLACLVLSFSLHAQYIYIANTFDATVMKIDINTNTVVGTYRTWYGTAPYAPGKTPTPSRIAVDSSGEVYVLNRFVNTPLNPYLLKILPSGGLPTSTNTTPLPLNDVDGSNDLNGPDLAQVTADRRLAWSQKVGDAGGWGRALCFDLGGNLWIGMNATQKYLKIHPSNPSVVLAVVPTPAHTPYGCVVDSGGTLYSASSGPTVARINTNSNTLFPGPHLNHGNLGQNYGISALNGCGSQSRIYFSNKNHSGKPYIALDTVTGTFTQPLATVTPPAISYAVAVDLDGNVISGLINGRIIKFDPAGNVIWDTNTLGTTQGMPDLHGLIIDSNNEIWAVDRNNNRVVKYRTNGTHEANVAVGLEPYTYANATPPNCPCGIIREPQVSCQSMTGGTGIYSWGFNVTNQSPFGTATTMEINSANPVTVLTPTSPYQFTPPLGVGSQATVNGTFSVANAVPGDRVCFDIRLTGGRGSWCCPAQQVCFTLPECLNCAKLTAKVQCGSDGKYYVYLTVTNTGQSPVQSVQVFSTTPGVTVNPSTVTVTLPVNTPVTLPPLAVTGATAGQTINVTVNTHGPLKDGVYSWCCTATVAVRMPDVVCHIDHLPN